MQSRLAELLPPEFGDADVWRCAHKAVQVLTAKVIWRRQSARAIVDATIVRICAMQRLRSWLRGDLARCPNFPARRSPSPLILL